MPLDVISQYFSILLSLIMFLWVAKYFYVLWYYRKQKEYINKVEARVAILKMLLKTKLKRKSAQMMEKYKSEKEFLVKINSKLEMLCTYSLSRPTDYTDIVDLLANVTDHVDEHEMKKSPSLFLTQVKMENERKEAFARLSAENADEYKKSQQKSNEGKKKSDESSSAASDPMVFQSSNPQFEKWTNLLKYDKGNLYIIKEIIDSTLHLIEKIDLYNSEQDNKELHIKKPQEIHLHGFDYLKQVVDLDMARSRLIKEKKAADDAATLSNQSQPAA